MNFSSSQKDPSVLRETAILSQKVINMIENAPELSNLQKQVFNPKDELSIEKITSHTLSERIKRVLADVKTHDESRNQILGLFTHGVDPPERIFHQERIIHAKGQSREKLVYDPNCMITNQIFQILGQNSPKKIIRMKSFILTGYKGVSKTISVSLLWYLRKFIDDYRFSSSYKEEQGHSFKDAKIVYVSYQPNDTQPTIYQKIMFQLPELKMTLDQFIQKKFKIGSWYEQKYGVKVFIIIDQIDSLSRRYRKMQFEKSQCQKRKMSCLVSQFQEEQNIKMQMRVISKTAQSFSKAFYLSPEDIKTDFLKKADLNGSGSHTIIQSHEIKYAEKLYQDASLKEICHAFFFQLEDKKLKPNNIKIENSLILEAEKKCFQFLKQKLFRNEYFFTTFLNIHGIIKSLQVKQSSKTSEIVDDLIQEFIALIEKSTQIVIKQFMKSFQKKDEKDFKRKILMAKLYLKCKDLEKENSQPSQHSFRKKIQKSYQIDMSQLNLTEEQFFDFLPQSFFGLICHRQIVHLRLPVQLVLSILEPKITSILPFYLNNVQSLFEDQTISSMEKYAEILLILAFKRKNTNFKLMYKLLSNSNNVFYQSENFQISKNGFYPFIALRPKNETQDHKNQQFLPKFKESLQRMINSGQKCAIFLPIKSVYSDFQPQTIDQESKTQTSHKIDSAIVKIQFLGGKYHITLNLIDVAVGQEKNLVSNKILNFLKEFLSCSDQNECTIRLKKGTSYLDYIIYINYFVFYHKIPEEDLQTQINNDCTIQSKLKIIGSKQTNLFQVEQKKNLQSPLSCIGVINFTDDTQIRFGSTRDYTENPDEVLTVESIKRMRDKLGQMKKNLAYK